MSRFVILSIKLYRYCLSPFFGAHCRFDPSCSEYAAEAVAKYGTLRGLLLSFERLARCHPWCEGGHDPLS